LRLGLGDGALQLQHLRQGLACLGIELLGLAKILIWSAEAPISPQFLLLGLLCATSKVCVCSPPGSWKRDAISCPR